MLSAGDMYIDEGTMHLIGLMQFSALQLKSDHSS